MRWNHVLLWSAATLLGCNPTIDCPDGTTLDDEVCRPLIIDMSAVDGGPPAPVPCGGECPEGLSCSPILERCVQCLGPEDCSEDRPLCNNSGTCIECRWHGDCSDPSAPACHLGLCEGCIHDGPCSEREGTPVCDVRTGGCVQCTEEDSDACGEGACDVSANTCLPAS